MGLIPVLEYHLIEEGTGQWRVSPQRFREHLELLYESGYRPVTMSEVGTKLDLARAYVDMCDPEGARSILEEVLSEGSASQRDEAQRLIDGLPGA
jgi:FimV-like protein